MEEQYSQLLLVELKSISHNDEEHKKLSQHWQTRKLFIGLIIIKYQNITASNQ